MPTDFVVVGNDIPVVGFKRHFSLDEQANTFVVAASKSNPVI